MLRVKLVLRTPEFRLGRSAGNVLVGEVEFDSLYDLRSHLMNGAFVDIVDDGKTTSVRCCEIVRVSDDLSTPYPAPPLKTHKDRSLTMVSRQNGKSYSGRMYDLLAQLQNAKSPYGIKLSDQVHVVFDAAGNVSIKKVEER